MSDDYKGTYALEIPSLMRESERDRPALTETEVTDAMIAAGAAAAWPDGTPPVVVVSMVRRVFEAMDRERRRPGCLDTVAPGL